MSILVFGRTGQVARALQRLAPADTLYLGRADADLADAAACVRAIETHAPDTVINAAAWTGVDEAEDNEAAAHLVNAVAPAAMARACAARGVVFLHLSTDYVFDGAGDAPFKPGDITRPLGAYGRTKRDGENFVRAAGGVQAILRTSWVFSAHGRNFVTTMLRLSAGRESLDVVADQVGGPTPANAVADTLLRMAKRLSDTPGAAGTYHLSGAPDASWADFAREIFRQSGHAVAVREIPSTGFSTRAPRPKNSRLDGTTLKDRYGIDRPDWRLALTGVLAELGAKPS